MLDTDQWNDLWRQMPDVNDYRDAASDAVISFLSWNELAVQDDTADDDPIHTLQAAMEIGYLLCLRQRDLGFIPR